MFKDSNFKGDENLSRHTVYVSCTTLGPINHTSSLGTLRPAAVTSILPISAAIWPTPSSASVASSGNISSIS